MLTGACHCGDTGWTFEGDPGSVTACNCTLCRQYGALWIYADDGQVVTIRGETAAYRRRGKANPSLEMVFCPACAGVLAWRGLRATPEGRYRTAVNLRLAPPDTVAHLVIDHFDGLDTFEDLPRSGRCVRDLWA